MLKTKKFSTFDETNNTWRSPVDIGANASNVDLSNGKTIEEVLGDYTNDDSVAELLVPMTGASGSIAGIGGLVPTPAAGDNTKVLKGDGTWGSVDGVSDMTGATETIDGIHGLVPKPFAGDQNKVLYGKGQWGDLPIFRGVGGSIQSISGMVPAAESGDEDSAFCGDGTFKNIIDMIYPINSVYISMINTNPSTYWAGTTWELLSDGYLRNNATNETGGSLTSGSTTLTAAQIPSHSHTITTGSYGAHTHTLTTGSYGAHTHTLTVASSGAHTHTAKTGSYGAHTHGFANAYASNRKFILDNGADAAGYGCYGGGTFSNRTVITHDDSSKAHISIASGGAHTHTLTVASSGAHTHTATTGKYGAHTHTATTGSYGNHTHTGTTQAIGGGQGHTHSIEPTYTRVYAFKRTA